MTVPNYKKNVGRLVTDRYDFQDHIDGYNNKHKAVSITLSPPVVIGSAKNNVQDAIAALSTFIVPPVVPDATTTAKGIIKLAGDIGGASSSVSVLRLRGFPILSTPPSTNTVLTWTGVGWEPQALPPVLAPNDASTTVKGIIRLSGDVGGTATNITVTGLQTVNISATLPSVNGHVLTFNSATSEWEPAAIPATGSPNATTTTQGIIRLAGDLGGTATVPIVTRLQGYNVKTTSPQPDYVLTYTTSGWEPKPLGTTVIPVSITPYSASSTVKNTAFFITTATIAITITLPSSPTPGLAFTFKDISGNASNKNITLTSSDYIEGLPNDYVLDADFQNLQLIADNNNNWWII